MDRYTASAVYNLRLENGANWQTTACWGRNRKEERSQDGVLPRVQLVERPQAHALPQGAERRERRALRVRAGRVGVGIGGLLSLYRLPEELKAAYGDSPISFMLFLRSIVR